MNLGKELEKILPASRIRARYIDVVSFASDAGFYTLLPKAVVKPNSEAEIVQLFSFSHQHNIPLVFRGGGTSLSGQSITDGILVDLSQYWNQLTVLEAGNMVRAARYQYCFCSFHVLHFFDVAFYRASPATNSLNLRNAKR